MKFKIGDKVKLKYLDEITYNIYFSPVYGYDYKQFIEKYNQHRIYEICYIEKDYYTKYYYTKYYYPDNTGHKYNSFLWEFQIERAHTLKTKIKFIKDLL